MFELILVRHGEAEGQGTYLGRHSDPPLTEEGRKQVLQLRQRLKTRGLLPPGEALLFSSPQIRALETAEILFGDSTGGGASYKSPEVLDEFAEMDFGDWDGMNWREISRVAPDAYRNWLDDPVGKAPPGGETMPDLICRVEKGLYTVTEAGEGRSIITAHGGVIRALICSLLKLPPEAGMSFDVANASFSIIRLYISAGGERSAVLNALNH